MRAITLGLLIPLSSACSTYDVVGGRRDAIEHFRAGLQARTAAIVDGRTSPLTETQCIDAALQNNLELQLASFDEAAAECEAGLRGVDMLPKIDGSGTLSWRDKRPYSRSEYRLGGGGIRDAYATASESTNTAATIELAWSPLDFGLAWYANQQARLGALAKGYARQRVAQRLIATLRQEFGRTQAAAASAPLYAAALQEAEAALAAVRRLRATGMATPGEEATRAQQVAQQRALCDQNAAHLQQARAALAAAMGIDPTAVFEVALGTPDAPALPPVESLLHAVLAHRPELFQSDLGVEQARIEIEKAWLRRFPNVQLLASNNYDDNKFLLYDDYNRIAGRLTVDLWQSLLGREQDLATQRRGQAAADREVASLGAVLQAVRARGELAGALAQLEAARQESERAARTADEYERQVEAGVREGLEQRDARIAADVSQAKWRFALDDAVAAAARLEEATGAWQGEVR